MKDVDNPLITQEDLHDHIGVAITIRGSNDPNHVDYNHILVFDHKKYSFVTIPTGKAKLTDRPILGAIAELREETGIIAREDQLKLVATKKDYKKDRGNGIITNIPIYVYLLTDYLTQPINLEPHKHSNMRFVNFKDLLKEKKLSVVTEMAIKYLNEGRMIHMENADSVTSKLRRLYDRVSEFGEMFVNKFILAGRAYEANLKKEDVDPKELEMGIKVEYDEHTKSQYIATHIALDHLSEIRDYYSRLAKMEKEAKEYWANKEKQP